MKEQTPVDTQMLMRAVDEADVERVKSLLAAGADANAAAEGGETALMRAVSKGNLEIVEVLLNAGGDVHAKSENGFTPLFMAVFFGHAEIARTLLARGSDPSEPTRINVTAEKWARAWGSAEIVELLKNADAVRAQGSAPEDATASVEQTDSPPIFFPAGGEIRPVVPLSEMGGARRARETTPLAEAGTGEPGESVRAGVGQTEQVEQYDAPEETTLVPARLHRATETTGSLHVWPKRTRRTWPLKMVAIALSVVAGLMAGAYLIESRQSVAPQRSAPPPQLPKPSLPAENELATGAGAHAVNDGEAGEKAEDVNREESARKQATSVRVPVAEPPSRRVVNAEARAERTANTAGGSVERSTAAGRPARRDAAATTRARVTERPSPTPAPPKRPLLVSSPPPSVKSKKVIPWP